MLVYAGQRRLPVKLPRSEATTMVTLSYVREGTTIEWLEGWVNPAIFEKLDMMEKYVLIAQAQRKLCDIVNKVVK